MKIASLAQVKAQFSAYLKDSEHGPVIVTRNGKPVAVLLGVRDDDVEQLALAHSSHLRKILEAARTEIREGKGIGHDEFWQKVKEKPLIKVERKGGVKRPS
jgi:prevent-host-death family protein